MCRAQDLDFHLKSQWQWKINDSVFILTDGYNVRVVVLLSHPPSPRQAPAPQHTHTQLPDSQKIW